MNKNGRRKYYETFASDSVLLEKRFLFKEEWGGRMDLFSTVPFSHKNDRMYLIQNEEMRRKMKSFL
jgi:hypothetical protein